MTISRATLDGGLEIVTESMPDARSVTLGFWVGTGSADEPGPLWGASHFLEHLLFKGTEERSARAISEAVDAVGGDLNAFTTKEYTSFYVRLLAEQLELGLDILSDILWSPAFRAEEVESERQVILEEILMHNDEPSDLVHEVLAEAMWPAHTLGREVLGEEATILAMTREQIAAFHAEHYRPANVVFAAAGALDHDTVADGVARRLAGRTAGGARPARRGPAAPDAATAVVERDTEQAHLAVGVPGLARHDERRYALSILDHILGSGMSSRLFQTVREERGLAYSVYSYRQAYEHAGALVVYAGTAPDKAREVLDLVHDELDRMAADGITAAELEGARGHLRGSLVLGLEDSGSRMSRVGHALLTHGRVPTVEELEERFAAVSLDDVAELAAEVLGGPRSVAVVGPFPDEGIAER
ncbi:MAG TPA: pitrilysin family protein [Acidimicrobiales bacterium]|nr:pitrilysin family protein [Acidimicrobiales bacterium]